MRDMSSASQSSARSLGDRRGIGAGSALAQPVAHERRIGVAVLASSLLLTWGAIARAQTTGSIPPRQPVLDHITPPHAASDSPRMEVPFSTGERLTFDVKFGPLRVGTGNMEVLGTEIIRGREAWRTRFTVKGSALGFRVRDRLESWMDTRTLNSLRFVQDLEEGGRDRERHYEIFPESDTYVEKKNGQMQKSVDNPLDDGSFLYFVRTMDLEIGQTYDLDRYFRADRNPVRIKVLRRERITVPAGTYETIVIQPFIKTSKIFSQNGKAEIWLTEDDRRMMVQVKTNLSFGTLNLFLRKSRAAGAAEYDPR